jgi:hypothetical protein
MLKVLSEAELDMVAGGVGQDLTSGYGIVSAIQHGGAPINPNPFNLGTGVPAQAAASYYNHSFVADGLYTAGLSPYGNGTREATSATASHRRGDSLPPAPR